MIILWILCIIIILKFCKFSWNLVNNKSLSRSMPVNFVSVKYHVFIKDVERIVELINVIELCEIGVIIITA